MFRAFFAAIAVMIAASAAFLTAPASAQVRNELMDNAERMLAESGRPRCTIQDPRGGGLAEVPCGTAGSGGAWGGGYNPGYQGSYGYQQPTTPQQMNCTAVLGGLLFSTCRAGAENRRARQGELRYGADCSTLAYNGRQWEIVAAPPPNGQCPRGARINRDGLETMP